MGKSPFVSLHNHTELGSPLDGMNDINQLFDQAQSLDHRAIAITDHDSTAHYDCYSFTKNWRTIPGVEAILSRSFY